MKPTLQTISFAFLLATQAGPAQPPDAATEERLHFVLIKGTESSTLRPVPAESPVEPNQTRISCREIELSTKYGKRRTVFIDARIEYKDYWIAGTRIEPHHGPDGLRFSIKDLTRHFKTKEAEQKYKLHTAGLSLDAIDRGLVESAKEHPEIAKKLIKKSSLSP